MENALVLVLGNQLAVYEVNVKQTSSRVARFKTLTKTVKDRGHASGLGVEAGRSKKPHILEVLVKAWQDKGTSCLAWNDKLQASKGRKF